MSSVLSPRSIANACLIGDFIGNFFVLHRKVTELCWCSFMADENSGPIADGVQALKASASDGDGPSVAGDGSHLTAALIVRKLPDSGVDCEIVHPVPTDAAVIRRDRVVIVLAVALLTALAWGYLLRLSAGMDMGGMDMGGMDMTGLRMIPSGIGLMMP